jgi:predicted AAA+ superfamily ATPase
MSTAYTLRPWTDIVEPHVDVRSGDLAMGTYAANLAAVAEGRHTGAAVYSDPDEFFASTYFTEAMQKVLSDAWRVLAGKSGDRVLQLRTPFGGGKTHTLLALYHLATSPRAAHAVPELSDLPDPGPVRTAVLSGEYLDPQRGREVDDRRILTMWGELAFQLGGWEAYDEMLVDGQEGAPPGGEILGRLLGDASSLILIDEAVHYVAKGRAIERGDSDVARLTMLFLQNLSEAVNQSRCGALVYSLQSSVGEAVGEEQLLRDLEKIAARIDTRREPVSGDEVLRVVQRRLFESLGDEAVHREVAQAYAANLESELTAIAETESDRREARDRAQALEQRILLAYPFHPELLDIMQHRWASLATYQRTRGALQFLATVLNALWSGEGRAGALIGPGDIDFAHEGTRSTFFEQVGEERQYRAVVEADFLAGDAGAGLVDGRLGGESPALANLRVGSRVATAIMLMSFGQQEGEDRGAPEREVLDATVTPELDGNLVRAALRELRGEALLYLHHTGRRYRFEPRPNPDHSPSVRE